MTTPRSSTNVSATLPPHLGLIEAGLYFMTGSAVKQRELAEYCALWVDADALLAYLASEPGSPHQQQIRCNLARIIHAEAALFEARPDLIHEANLVLLGAVSSGS
ncbi:hypothetical protein HJC99_04645 [Candidatus Saccharibacteria bacterium]|nr:hypothetical protein [Candidatus Saccharibacteria bacterium]